MANQRFIIGCVLAGGRSSRMGGGEKPLLRLAGRRMLDRALDRLAPQVDRLAVSANGRAPDYARDGVALLRDPSDDRPGPIAGVLAALAHAEALGADAVVTAAADSPFFPLVLVEALADAARRPDVVAVAASDAGWHPTFALWPVGVRADLEASLAEGEHRMRRLIERQAHRAVRFPPIRVGDRLVDPFTNVNTPEDLMAAEEIAALVDREEERS